MGGGSEFPAELVKELLNSLGRNAAKEPAEKDFEKKQNNQKYGKQGRDTKIKERNSKKNEEKKEKVIKVKESSKVGKDKRQPESTEVAKCAEENRRQIQSTDKGEDRRKDREDEKREKKEMAVNGLEKSRTEEAGKVQDMGKEVLEEHDGRVEGNDEKQLKDKLKMMEGHVKSVMKKRKELGKSERENDCREDEGKALGNLEGRIEVKDEKKHKEREKQVKEYIKKGKKEKKEVKIPEGEKDQGTDEFLDKNLTPNDKNERRKDKGRYNVEKLKSKLSKLDAKMEKIAAKSEIYLKKLKEVEKSSAYGGEIVESDRKESIVYRMTNKLNLLSAPIASKTDLPDIPTEMTSSEFHEDISDRILYPKLEEKDMTGAGY